MKLQKIFARLNSPHGSVSIYLKTTLRSLPRLLVILNGSIIVNFIFAGFNFPALTKEYNFPNIRLKRCIMFLWYSIFKIDFSSKVLMGKYVHLQNIFHPETDYLTWQFASILIICEGNCIWLVNSVLHGRTSHFCQKLWQGHTTGLIFLAGFLWVISPIQILVPFSTRKEKSLVTLSLCLFVLQSLYCKLPQSEP